MIKFQLSPFASLTSKAHRQDGKSSHVLRVIN
jgi:hypothetical protein